MTWWVFFSLHTIRYSKETFIATHFLFFLGKNVSKGGFTTHETCWSNCHFVNICHNYCLSLIVSTAWLLFWGRGCCLENWFDLRWFDPQFTFSVLRSVIVAILDLDLGTNLSSWIPWFVPLRAVWACTVIHECNLFGQIITGMLCKLGLTFLLPLFCTEQCPGKWESILESQAHILAEVFMALCIIICEIVVNIFSVFYDIWKTHHWVHQWAQPVCLINLFIDDWNNFDKAKKCFIIRCLLSALLFLPPSCVHEFENAEEGLKLELLVIVAINFDAFQFCLSSQNVEMSKYFLFILLCVNGAKLIFSWVELVDPEVERFGSQHIAVTFSKWSLN